MMKYELISKYYVWDPKKVKLTMTKALTSTWKKPLKDKFMQKKFFFPTGI